MSKYNKRIQHYLDNSEYGSYIFDEGLLDEMVEFSNNFRAKRVHRKCLKVGKLELAKRIARKYSIKPLEDDLIKSLEIMINSMKL